MKRTNKRKIAVFPVLLFNIFFPGLGTLLSGNRSEGLWQISLFLLSIFVFFLGLLFSLTIIGIIIGVPLLIIAPGIFVVSWIWALISSFN